MIEDLDRQLKKIKSHLNSASDYAQRARDTRPLIGLTKLHTILGAIGRIDTAISMVNKLRRQLLKCVCRVLRAISSSANVVKSPERAESHGIREQSLSCRLSGGENRHSNPWSTFF